MVFGLVAAFWPISTALTLVMVWGVYALVSRCSEDVTNAFRMKHKRRVMSPPHSLPDVMDGRLAR